MTSPIVAVTVLGDDRPGIVADVTRALAALHGNLEDSTMTLLRGHFVMVLLVRTPATAPEVEAALAPLTLDGSLVINARPLTDYDALPEPQRHATAARSFALHVHGADRPGIVADITATVARHGGNIVDLGTRLAGDLYVLMAEIELPQAADAERLSTDLRRSAGALGVEVSLSTIDDDLL